MSGAHDIDRLLEIMARLRDPHAGCPWDLDQDFASIAPYTLEEAFEVADAIAREDYPELCDELGDLLLQVVFHAQMAAEKRLFDFADVVRAINAKMIRRHPHVFGDRQGASMADIHATWEQTKADEQQQRGKTRDSRMDGVPAALPALSQALKLQKRAKGVGFDWGDVAAVIACVRGELDELEAAMVAADTEHAREELGDVLFSLVNLARHLETDPEISLRRTSHRFEQRFRLMEAMAAADNTSLVDLPPASLETLWCRAKERLGQS